MDRALLWSAARRTIQALPQDWSYRKANIICAEVKGEFFCGMARVGLLV
jgi:hypothetical protein